MQNLGGIFCSICLDYFCKPVAANCGHSFCQFCLEEYFLHTEFCPICETSIRKDKPNKETCLANFVENYIRKEHSEYMPRFEERVKQLAKYKQDRTFTVKEMVPGLNVDIRDNNYLWRQARIIRIISRVGEDTEEKVEEQLKMTSERLSIPGFYTNRTEIPKFGQIIK